MIFPTINDLNEGEYNRYEVALAAAKCARMITNEYVRQRAAAEASMISVKENEKPLNAMIDREIRDEKAVNIAVHRLYDGKYVITHKSVEEQEAEEQAVLESINELYRPRDRRDEDDLSEGESAEDGESMEAAEDGESAEDSEAVEDDEVIEDAEDGEAVETAEAADAAEAIEADGAAVAEADI